MSPDKGKKEILLESGTNEIELIEFTIADNTFGINVAKVKEIMIPQPVKEMPKAHPAIEGVFKPRDHVITVIDLPKYLDLPETTEPEKSLFIITNFNKLNVAFRVHQVVGIDRISWGNIQKPDKTIYGGDDGVATGIAECQGRLITILDFEKIVAEISPESGVKLSELDKYVGREKNPAHILMAEDSQLLSKMIFESLTKAGYTNITKFENGQDAWEYVEKYKDSENIREDIACIITDIEMPKMDGHRFTKLIKADKNLRKIPLVIFSSLITKEMYDKGKILGADEQLTKPEIGNLVETVDHLLTMNI